MKKLSSRMTRTLGAIILGTALSSPAFAIDDRENTSPTGWLWRIHHTSAQIQTLIGQGWRLVDIEVESASPPTFTAAFVANSGAHQKTSWWLPLGSAAQLNSMLTTNKARLTDVEVVDVGGVSYYSAIMEDNTGANGKAWWHYYDSNLGNLMNAVYAVNGRPIDFEQYVIGGFTYYAVVAISNSGADNRAWWWYLNATPAYVDTMLATNKAQPYLAEKNAVGNLNVIMTQSGARSWWFTGRTTSEVNDLCGQYGARVVGVDPDTGGTLYTVVLLNNSNDLTVRVGDILRNGSDGYSGVLLKKANGALLASLNNAKPFEPASMLKTLHHFYAMRQVNLGTDNLANLVTFNTGLTGSCPNDTMPVTWTLEQTLSAMMKASDNAATKAISLRYSWSMINAQAAALGMANTQINHHIGCGNPPNTTTLDDIAKLHEAVVNGFLGGQRQKFYSLMRTDYVGSGYAEGKLDPIITQEAQSVGLTPNQENAFRNAFFTAFKKGGYGTGAGYFRTWGGYVLIPFYTNGGIVDQEYSVGSYVAAASNEPNAINAAASAFAEVLRDELHAAMLTWKSHVAGSFSSFGIGCPGTNGTPYQSTSGVPELGQHVSYSLANGRSYANATMFLGGSKTQWGALTLPLSLGLIGAPSCTLYTDGSVQLGLLLNVNGAGSRSLSVPLDSALVGGVFYTQYVVLDAGANAANLTLSNAQTTYLGGMK
jgi:hypothetical protein